VIVRAGSHNVDYQQYVKLQQQNRSVFESNRCSSTTQELEETKQVKTFNENSNMNSPDYNHATELSGSQVRIFDSDKAVVTCTDTIERNDSFERQKQLYFQLQQ